MALFVVGDMHLNSNNEIKYKQTKMFMEWFKNQDFNDKNNSVLFLGDLIEFNSSYEAIGYMDNWFNELKFKKILIIEGNHDKTPYDNIMNCFKSNKRIQFFSQPTVYDDEDLNLKYLFLPHYDCEGTNYVDMYKRYSNLYKEEEFNQTFDYGFGHITDETQNFGNGEFCDTSKLNVDKWLLGHIHNGNFQDKKGHYLGSVIKNSSAENNQKYIAEIKN